MKLSDLLQQAKGAYQQYANSPFGGLASKIVSGGIDQVSALQNSINKSSPGFKQTTTNQSGTPVATDVITAPTVPTPEPIRDGKGNPIATPVDWNANYAYLAGQGDKSAQDWIDQNTIDETQPTSDGSIDFSTPTSDVAYSMEKLNELYGTKSPEDLWALRQKLRFQQSQASAGDLPASEYMDYQGLPGLEGQKGYTYDQQMGINKSTADIFGTQVSDLDKFMANQTKAAGTSNQVTDNERALMTQFTSSPIVKDYNTVISSKNLVDGIVQNFQGGSSDIAEIYAFMKALDPNSVVREAEYDTAALNAGNFFQGKFAKLNGMFKEGGGFLSENARKQFQNVVNGAVLSKQKQYEPLARQFREIAKRQGMNPDNVVIDFSQGIGDTGTAPSTGTSSWNQNADGTWSFKQVGGGTNTAIGGLPDAMKRIARNESPSGNYQELGPVVTSGQYRGQRALGLYQVMPGNIPAWSKEALGYSITPQQFLNSPQLQEQIVAHQMTQAYKKYGNWSDVASVWFTGRPLAQGRNARDVLGTSGGEYVRRFNA